MRSKANSSHFLVLHSYNDIYEGQSLLVDPASITVILVSENHYINNNHSRTKTTTVTVSLKSHALFGGKYHVTNNNETLYSHNYSATRVYCSLSGLSILVSTIAIPSPTVYNLIHYDKAESAHILHYWTNKASLCKPHPISHNSAYQSTIISLACRELTSLIVTYKFHIPNVTILFIRSTAQELIGFSINLTNNNRGYQNGVISKRLAAKIFRLIEALPRAGKFPLKYSCILNNPRFSTNSAIITANLAPNIINNGGRPIPVTSTESQVTLTINCHLTYKYNVVSHCSSEHSFSGHQWGQTAPNCWVFNNDSVAASKVILSTKYFTTQKHNVALVCFSKHLFIKESLETTRPSKFNYLFRGLLTTDTVPLLSEVSATSTKQVALAFLANSSQSRVPTGSLANNISNPQLHCKVINNNYNHPAQLVLTSLSYHFSILNIRYWAMSSTVVLASEQDENYRLSEEEFEYEEDTIEDITTEEVELNLSISNVSANLKSLFVERILANRQLDEEITPITQQVKGTSETITATPSTAERVAKFSSTGRPIKFIASLKEGPTHTQPNSNPQPDLNSNKRGRGSTSSDEGLTAPKTKVRRTFAEMLPMAAIVATNSIVVDIISDKEGEETLSDIHLRTIGNSVNAALFADKNFAKLLFEFSGPERGKFRIICANKETSEWVTGTVPLLEGLWPGAALKTVVTGPPPTLVRATVNLGFPTMDPNDFFTVINTQNPNINTSNWKLFNRNKPSNGKQIWIIGVDESSIQSLRDVNCRPYCGMSRIRINLPN